MIITSMSRQGYDDYGSNFISSFFEHCFDEMLTVYHEGLPPDPITNDRLSYVDMTKQQSFLQFARALHEADPMYKGAVRAGKDDKIAYNYRFDAFKFFRKVWSLKHYDETRLGYSVFTWLDADIVFTKALPKGFFPGLLKDGDYVAYIGRGSGMHSECGAMVFDPNHSQHSEFFELYWRTYETGAFRYLVEWHDCMVFDFVRDLTRVPATNLGKGCDPIHPFVFTKFGLYMDHLKGPERKAMGQSPESLPALWRKDQLNEKASPG